MPPLYLAILRASNIAVFTSAAAALLLEQVPPSNGPLYLSVSGFTPYLAGLLLALPLKSNLVSTVLGLWLTQQ